MLSDADTIRWLLTPLTAVELIVTFLVLTSTLGHLAAANGKRPFIEGLIWICALSMAAALVDTLSVLSLKSIDNGWPTAAVFLRRSIPIATVVIIARLERRVLLGELHAARD